jgi:membrane fusion protein (multidrug efflux system)
MNNTALPSPSAPAAGETKPRRPLPKKALAAAVLLIAAAAAILWSRNFRGQEMTEDAYVDGNIVQVTPQVSGTVISIGADNTEEVKAGQVLVQLDPTDAKLALSRAEAQLAKAVRQIRNQFATTAQLQANVAAREADLARSLADRAQREGLAQSGAIPAEEMRHAIDAVKSAEAALAAARHQAEAMQALTEGTEIENHPEVAAAATQVREAYIALERTRIVAPVDGMVTRRSVQLGQRIGAGTPLMSLVALNDVWVNANFKESQLAHIRAGQAVTLTADVYGSKVQYTGHVVGLEAGTGSAFSLMPAQNATGNWVKVVQRVPVRIALNRDQLSTAALRVGLSMKVTVDTAAGATLPQAGTLAHAERRTAVFDLPSTAADDVVRQIVHANLRQGAARRQGA